MPELNDDMYCSQQIMVPPMFPYLLRQYAKAAIRSQPSDLLRWSTAYFRCLSLNLPPPVKPRLEYPIPRDYQGITPGWLKALLCQLEGSKTVDYKVLWDRWMGACLIHPTLIKILVLGDFREPFAIPFLRFLALCCGFISDNLTETMILVCEVMTEEPEGGSAMITVEVFVDLYKFLANIDASKDQILLNKYFTDDLLGLIEKQAEQIKPKIVAQYQIIDEAPASVSESIVEEEKPEVKAKESISCPDLLELADVDTDKSSSDTEKSKATITNDKDMIEVAKAAPPLENEDLMAYTATQRQVYKETKITFDEKTSKVDAETEIKPSDETGEGSLKSAEVLENIEDLQQERDQVEKAEEEEEQLFEEDITEDIHKYFQTLEDGDEVSIVSTVVKPEQSVSMGFSEVGEEEEERQVPEAKVYEEVFVEAIPGIGGKVPEELVEAVIEYMYKCAKRQHGMVMPRNIKHFSCPPLEVLD